ncbi:MAG: hypothetical protein V1698_00640, partial [bacterium]
RTSFLKDEDSMGEETLSLKKTLLSYQKKLRLNLEEIEDFLFKFEIGKSGKISLRTGTLFFREGKLIFECSENFTKFKDFPSKLSDIFGGSFSIKKTKSFKK